MSDVKTTVAPEQIALATGSARSVPLMTREAFAHAIGLPLGVLVAQAERGYWPEVKVGKWRFINVEAVRQKLLERGQEFAL